MNRERGERDQTGRAPSVAAPADRLLIRRTHQSASALADLLNRTRKKIVLAESCTAGLVAAVLGSLSGISDRLCGSMVTYRESTKRDWLGIEPHTIRRHTAVSEAVTRAMAQAVLEQTSEADYSVAITGHLQPPESDSAAWVFMTLAHRPSSRVETLPSIQKWLRAHSRIDRQWEAAGLALQLASEHIGRLETPADRSTEHVR